MANVLIFDTETTDKDEPELIEAAWVRVESVVDLAGTSDRIPEPFGLDGEFVQRYKPTKRINYGAMAVHNILPEELYDCDPSDSFSLSPDTDYIIGHNIDFDWRVAGEPPIKRICTDAMARYIWQDADSYSQSALLYMLAGATDDTRRMLRDAHSALADVYNNARLVAFILAERPEIRTWSELYAYSETCRIPRGMPFGKAKGDLLTDLPSLDFGYCQWLLRQDWLDPYLRQGVELALNPPQDETEPDAATDDVPF